MEASISQLSVAGSSGCLCETCAARSLHTFAHSLSSSVHCLALQCPDRTDRTGLCHGTIAVRLSGRQLVGSPLLSSHISFCRGLVAPLAFNQKGLPIRDLVHELQRPENVGLVVVHDDPIGHHLVHNVMGLFDMKHYLKKTDRKGMERWLGTVISNQWWGAMTVL